MFLAALILAGATTIPSLLRTTHWTRILLVVLLLFLSLPWSEWLHQKHISSREDWTRQIFFHAIFIYSVLITFHFIPAIPRHLNHAANYLVNLISRKNLRWIPAGLFFLLTSYICIFIFKKTLPVQDSAAHFFQATIFSNWNISAPIPPVADFFSCVGDMLTMKDGKWFSIYPPGYSVLLALAMPFHAEWIITPLLGACSIAIWISYAARWHGIQAAALLGILCLFSPFLIAMSSTLMVHAPELFVASAILLLCRLETESTRSWRKIVLFLLLASVIPIRAFSLLIFLGPILAFACWKRIQARDWFFPIIVSMGIFTGAAVLAYFQWRTTGSPWVSGYLLEFGNLRYGFGATLGGVHTPLKGLENISNNMLGMDKWLTGWYSGGLFFLLASVVTLQKIDSWDRVLLLSTFAIVVFYYFYEFQNLVFGPRYYYIFAPFLLLLIARIAFHKDSSEIAPRSIILASFIVVALVTFLPKRFPYFATLFDPYRFEAGDLKKQMIKVGNAKTLIFLEQISPEYVDWNDPFLRSPVILCRDLKERNQEAIQAFPEYQPMYFRRSVRFSKEKIDSSFGLYKTPSNRPPGYFSLFELALALQTQERNPDRDFFEVCYDGFFTSKNGALQLQYLQEIGSREISEMAYKQKFRSAVNHIARMLLLPKIAYEEAGDNWKKHCSMDDIRKEFDLAVKSSSDAGEVGKAFSVELEKVRRRVDQNKDGVFSDQELSNFLSERLRIIRYE